ncbi:hypothetical protein X741_33500 [Mesorhizobium sp. LNHC229A00]|nr:hypothetical protein X741_33500 [Mesorhizobium sp. LNHC229A00]
MRGWLYSIARLPGALHAIGPRRMAAFYHQKRHLLSTRDVRQAFLWVFIRTLR